MYIIKHLPEDFIVTEVPQLSFLKTGKFAIYLLKKRDMNTHTALEAISVHFKIPLKKIGYAGLKDKCAVTSQYISIPASYSLPDEFSASHYKLSKVGYSVERLYPGNLKANTFTIIVRNILHAPKTRETCINYFGEQRFSSHNVAIGRSILQKKYEEAAQTIAQCERDFSFDSSNAFSAIQKLSFSKLRLYLHAYQSWIWNKCVTEWTKNNSQVNIDETFPLAGFAPTDDSCKEKLINDFLQKDSLKRSDFILRQLPGLGMEGGERNIWVKLVDLNIENPVDDVFHDAKKACTISFTLSKGSYATECIRQLFDE
ncbi:MAG: tRNA pseudouridine(13) synthase TruD [Candidatus Woesearchaeota archaeon]